MNFKNIKALQYTIIAFGVFIFVSCGSENQGDNTEGDTTADTTAIVEDNNEAAEATFSLPSPLQIASIFKRSGLAYLDGLTNPVSNVSKYSSNTSKAVNLGVYTSDLAYCVLNKQNQHSINYLKSSRELANQLGMGSIFEADNLSRRFEANLSKEDSLVTIITELQIQSDLFLEENELKHLSAVIFAGAWIESMYIGSKVHEKTNNEKITGKLVEQMTILENIIRALKVYESKDATIGPLIAQLVSIKDLYSGFASVKAATSSEDEEFSAPNLTADEFKTLAAKIDEIRNKIVKE